MPRLTVDDERIDTRLRDHFGQDDSKLERAMAKLSESQTYKTRDELLVAEMNRFMEVLEIFMQPAPPLPPQVARLWSEEGLNSSVKTIKSSPDGNEVRIQVRRPTKFEGPCPLVVYFHGGGMASGSAFDPTYEILGLFLARQGVAVALVDFRNSTLPSMSNQDVAPFPAGLNDCYSGLVWCHEHAEELGIDRSRVCVAGESGGGNLAIATALKCKKEGRMDLIPSGFFSLCPYIAGIWPRSRDDPNWQRQGDILGTSHVENNGLFLSLNDTTNYAMGYGIEAFEHRDPLAWPGFASVEDLRGLPRCVISVNECDPLRDEGINFYRRCLKAGVGARCRSVIGTVHAGDIFVGQVPDIALETARAIADFAYGDTAASRRPLPIPAIGEQSKL